MNERRERKKQDKNEDICSLCAGFGYIAEGIDMRRCHRDWHLLFSTMPGRWQPCPRCRPNTGPSGHQRQAINLVARLAYRRAIGSSEQQWQHCDEAPGWRRRRLDGQFIYRWRHLLVAPPGPAFGHGWTILEPDNVLRRQHRRQTRRLLSNAGAPSLPDLTSAQN